MTESPSNKGEYASLNYNEEAFSVAHDAREDCKSPCDSGKATMSTSILLLAGSIIGTGIFMTPNSVVKAIPSVGYSLLVWVFCGVVSMFAGLCYSELGCMFPRCGGEYVYLAHAYHDSVAFSFMFTNFLFIKPVSIAMLVLFFVDVCLSTAFPRFSSFWVSRLLSSLVAAMICLLNCSSNYWSLKVNDILTYSKFVCMAFLIGLGAYMVVIGKYDTVTDLGLSIRVSAAGISSAVYNGMWAYDGFNSLAYMVEEMKKPEKNLMPATVIGLGLVIGFYLVINMSYLVVLGVADLMDSKNVALSMVRPFLKNYSGVIVLFVALSAFGSANGTAFCGGRIYYDAAKKGHLPSLFASSHRKTGTMVPSLVMQTLLTIFFLFIAPDLDMLLMYFSGASWVFYTATFLAVIVMRFREPDNKNRKFKVFFLLPVITTLVGGTIVVLGFVQDWFSSLISVSLILVSFPIYFLVVRRLRNASASKPSCPGGVTGKIMKVFGLEIKDVEE